MTCLSSRDTRRKVPPGLAQRGIATQPVPREAVAAIGPAGFCRVTR